MAQLRYNPATGVWMPAPEARPRMRQFAQPEPRTRNKAYLAQIPVMPAYPRQPHIKYTAPDPRIQGPQYGYIPNRPVINQPKIPALPERVREKGKWGQYSLTDTVPNPKVLPKANMPNMHRYNTGLMRFEQAKIDQKIKNRGGNIPKNLAPYTTHGRKIKPKDLGINSTKGSNSKFLSFGSYLGRSVGSPF